MEREDVINLLKKAPMFKYFQVEAMDALLEVGTIRTFKEKEYLIYESNFESSMFVIINGSVSVTVTEEGKEVYICTIGDGEVVGEAGIFSKVRRTANILANEDNVVALEVKREGLLKFVKDQPVPGSQLLMIVIYSLLKKLRSVNQDLAFERKDDISQDDIDKIIRGIADNS